MPARRSTILVFLHVFTWLLLCSAERSFAFDNRKADSLSRALTGRQTDTNRIRILIGLSLTYQVDSPAKSFYYASEALFLSEKHEWQKGICSAEYMTAVIYVDVWELEEAVKHWHKCIKSARIIGDVYTERNCWQYLVHCYDHLGEQQKAFECQDRLLKMVMQTGDTAAICRQMSAWATVMFDNGRKQEGINSLNEDIRIAQAHLHGEIRNDVSAELLNTLAIQYMKLDRNDSAFPALRKAIPLAIAINDTPNIAYLISTLSFAHSAVKDYDSAEFYAKQTIVLAERMKDLRLLKNIHSSLSDIYEKKDQPEKALHHYKISDSISKLITESERTSEHAAQVSRVAIDQQKAHREQERRDLEAVNAEQKNALLLAIVGLFALAVIAGLIYRNLKNKDKTNKIIRAQAADLQKQNETIDAALRDKEILLQEMHHRVKNNLQLMSGLLELQIAKLADKNSVEALTVTKQRIYSIAMVHSKLYHTGGDASVEVNEFATDLFQSIALTSIETESKVRLENRIAEIHLPLNMLVPLGLILNELITNSFKHAFRDTDTATITLDMQQQSGSVIFTYTDSGPGIDTSRFSEESETLGLYLIKRLTRQLKGEMVYSNETGSTFTFTFPHERN